MGAYRDSIGISVLAVVLAGCSGGHKPPSATASRPAVASPAAVTHFTGIPMPPNNILDVDRTVVVGDQADWVGRIVFTSPMSVDDTVEFYRREMPRFGWSELAATRSETSVLSYQADARVATIQLQPAAQPRGTKVEFWVNPRPAGRTGAMTGPNQRGPSTAAISSNPGVDGHVPSFEKGPMLSPAPRTPVEQAPLPPWR